MAKEADPGNEFPEFENTEEENKMSVNLQFKRGTQAALNRITDPADGTFYLTTDTNRLYIGQSTTSGTKLVELNKSVTIVDKISQESTDASGLTYLPTTNIEEGQFYYVKDSNILCVYVSNNWVQINPDTFITKTDLTIEGVEKDKDKPIYSTIFKTTLTDSVGKKTLGDIKIKGTNGIRLNKSQEEKGKDEGNKPIYRDVLTIDGTIYDTQIAQTQEKQTNGSVLTNSKSATVQLFTEEDQEDPNNFNLKGNTAFILEGEGDIEVTADSNNKKIKIKPTYKVASGTLSYTPKSDKENPTSKEIAEQGTISLQLIDQDGNAIFRDPEDDDNPLSLRTDSLYYTIGDSSSAKNIKYYPKDHLPVYTIDEVNELARNFNKMEYKGTVGPNGTTKSLPTSGVQVGDVYMVSDLSGVGIKYYYKDKDNSNVQVTGTAHNGDLLIAQGTEYQASDTGVSTGLIGTIKPDTLSWDWVPSGNDYDSTYHFLCNSDSNKISLEEHSGTIVGSHQLLKGNDVIDGETTYTQPIQITSSYEKKTENNVEKDDTQKLKTTIEHSKLTVSKTENISDTLSQKNVTSITAVVGVEDDKFGHLKGYTTQKFDLMSYSLRGKDITITSDTNDTDIKKANLAVLSKNSAGSDTSEVSYNISSKTLNLKLGEKTITPASQNQIPKEERTLELNLVWGTFE